MTIRSTILILAIAAISVGCNARSAAQAPSGAYTEGGYGTAFYAEVPFAKEEGNTRIYVFGRIADYDAFLATKEVPENGHKKFIGDGPQGETVVIQDLKGQASKDNPDYTNQLFARFKARHPTPVASQP